MNRVSLPAIAFLAVLFTGILQTHVNAQTVQEFIVSDSGGHPRIVADGSGGFFAVWNQFRGGIWLGHHDANGITVRPPRQFPQTRYDDSPRIARRDSLLTVAWRGFSPRIMENPVAASMFTPEADTLRYQLFNADANNYSPDVAIVNDTTAIIVWAARSGIYAEKMIPSRTTQNVVAVDLYWWRNTGGYSQPKILHPDGDTTFFISWIDTTEGFYNLYGRRYGASLVPLGERFRISADPAMTDMFYYDAAPAPGGKMAFVWPAEKGGPWQLQWRWYDGSGSPITGVENLSDPDSALRYSEPSIAFDADGRSVVVWEEYLEKTWIIRARPYSPARLPIGEQFRISADTTGSHQWRPNVLLQHGNVVFVWEQAKFTDTSTLWRRIRGNIRAFSGITAVGNGAASLSPSVFRLDPCYPNPFNSQTMISFSLDRSSPVSLRVYDILGRQVAEIFNGSLEPGPHRMPWDADPLPSGVYYYHLSAREQRATGKMVLTR